MTGHAHERHRPRALPLGMAAAMVPRSLVDTDTPKPSKSYLGRSSADARAEHRAWLDEQPTRASCLHCPGWISEGTAVETREAALEHRALAHPGVKRKRGRAEVKAAHVVAAAKRAKLNETAAPGSLSVPQPSLVGRANGWASGEGNEPATGAAASVREGEPQAGQGTPPGASGLGDVAASSSPSRTPANVGGDNTLAGGHPDAKKGGPAGGLPRPQSSNPYDLAPLGRGFRWTRAASILAVQDYAQTVGSPPGQNASRGEPVGTLPSLTAARRLFGGWAGLVEAAGYARPAWGGTRIAGAA